MSHLDDETLAELALGGGRASDAEHAATCADCQSELATLQAMLQRAQSAGPSAGLLSPPDSVWDAITAELAQDNAPAETQAPLADARAGHSDDLAERRARRSSRLPLLAAAAAGVLVGALGLGAVLSFGSDDPGASVVAEVALIDLETEAPAGDAVLETRPDGSQVLVVSTDPRDVEDAYLEVWLIDEQIEGMVSLGHLVDGSGEFVIPPGFDVGAFPIVDISVEPLDGVPTHSGDSVTRGVFDA